MNFFVSFVWYSFIIFLSALIIIILIDFSDEDLKIFPLEATQFLVTIAFIGILFMLYNDFKKLYNFGSCKIKFLEELPQKFIEKAKKIKDKILMIKLNSFKKYIKNFFKTAII